MNARIVVVPLLISLAGSRRLRRRSSSPDLFDPPPGALAIEELRER